MDQHPEIRHHPHRFELLLLQLEGFGLVIRGVIITAGLEEVVWEQFSSRLSTHAQTKNFVVYNESLSRTPRNYSESPWVVSEPGNLQQLHGQKLKASTRPGIHLTLNMFCKIGGKIPNPLERDSYLLIFCMEFFIYISTSTHTNLLLQFHGVDSTVQYWLDHL